MGGLFFGPGIRQAKRNNGPGIAGSVSRTSGPKVLTEAEIRELEQATLQVLSKQSADGGTVAEQLRSVLQQSG